jgi:hypothetical protein
MKAMQSSILSVSKMVKLRRPPGSVEKPSREK